MNAVASCMAISLLSSSLQCYLPFKVIVGVHIPAVMFLASVRSLLALYFYRDLPTHRHCLSFAGARWPVCGGMQ